MEYRVKSTHHGFMVSWTNDGWLHHQSKRYNVLKRFSHFKATLEKHGYDFVIHFPR